MTLTPYNKPHATAQERVRHLQSRGLVIARPNVAARKIDLVGYERLRVYFLNRRQFSIQNRPFIPGTRYNDILRLYECDMTLRNICFFAVGHFELLLRNAMSEVLSAAYGSHPYYNHAAYRTPVANLDALQTFAQVYGMSKDQRAIHYKQTYSPPILPPIWTMKEFMTFGRTVRILKCLSNSLQQSISLQFGVPTETVFSNWLECLVDVRNICAHHDRLFNRIFQKQPVTLNRSNIPTAPKNKLKSILQCLDYLLDSRGYSLNVVAKVQSVISRYPEVHLVEVGY